MLLTQEKLPAQIIHFILEVIKPFYWHLLGILIVVSYWAIHISLQPYTLKLIVENLRSDCSSNMLVSVGCFALVSLLSILNFFFYDVICAKMYPKLKADILFKCTEIVSQNSYHFFQNQFAGNLANQLKELSTSTSEIVRIFIVRIFSNVLALVIASFTLYSIHPLLTLVLLLGTLVLLSLSFWATKKTRMLSYVYSKSNSHISGIVVDLFTNILSVRLFETLPQEKKQLENGLKDTIQCDEKLRWNLLKTLFVQSCVTSSMIFLCVLVLISNYKYQSISIGDFTLVLTLILPFSNTIWQFSQDISSFSELYGSVAQGVNLINQSFKDNKKIVPEKELVVKSGKIVFHKASFYYDNSMLALYEQSIIIKPGQKIGLVGSSGSGKSTFVNLILGLFELTSGNIYIDDQDISKVTEYSLHRSISMIPQDPILFHRTLMDNIRYGEPMASDDEVFRAAKMAQIHDFILNLPEGYSTVVGERGIKLSGGQRQRIAIARAMLKNAPILILDEATSALDSITESLIKEKLFKLMRGKTTIIIAHRLSTLLDVDQILVFHRGRIVEQGSHEELLTREGIYKTLWNTQIEGFIPSTKEHLSEIP